MWRYLPGGTLHMPRRRARRAHGSCGAPGAPWQARHSAPEPGAHRLGSGRAAGVATGGRPRDRGFPRLGDTMKSCTPSYALPEDHRTCVIHPDHVQDQLGDSDPAYAPRVCHGTPSCMVHDCYRCCNHAGSSQPYGQGTGPWHANQPPSPTDTIFARFQHFSHDWNRRCEPSVVPSSSDIRYRRYPLYSVSQSRRSLYCPGQHRVLFCAKPRHKR